jgi:hypothetical protein
MSHLLLEETWSTRRKSPTYHKSLQNIPEWKILQSLKFAPGFVNYNKEYTRLAAASDKVYQLLAHGRWFSPASSTTKTGRHDETWEIQIWV